MKLTLALLVTSLIACVSAFEFKRIDKKNAALIVLDHQVGLFHLVKDYTPAEYRNNILAHAGLGKAFDLPVVLSSSSETGPNGPLPKEIIDMYPNVTIVKRQGEVNAWDNSDFRKAVEATGKKQIIIAGITTDVCTAFCALSLLQAGYEVYANADASGTFALETARDANERMRDAGVNVLSHFAIVCDLMRDWRGNPGADTLLPYLDTYFPVYGFLARAHRAAINNGTIFPGENV
ncbi:Isochorismatase-like protein [Flagelloscypha sp. PMI_526]|nr:Isochorismatase-like protein [Flagelloscypha sp. PMI_526]